MTKTKTLTMKYTSAQQGSINKEVIALIRSLDVHSSLIYPYNTIMKKNQNMKLSTIPKPDLSAARIISAQSILLSISNRSAQACWTFVLQMLNSSIEQINVLELSSLAQVVCWNDGCYGSMTENGRKVCCRRDHLLETMSKKSCNLSHKLWIGMLGFLPSIWKVNHSFEILHGLMLAIAEYRALIVTGCEIVEEQVVAPIHVPRMFQHWSHHSSIKTCQVFSWECKRFEMCQANITFCIHAVNRDSVLAQDDLSGQGQ